MQHFFTFLFIVISFRSHAQNDHNMPANKENDLSVKSLGYEKRKPGSIHIGKKVEYDLYINDTMVNFTGKHRHAIAINGKIPAPTITFTEGDTAIIRVHNLMKMETSIHWHGILLPNKEDGVPYLTTASIKPGTTYTFTFPLIQSGTFWYHSHTMLQEQSGLYGSIVIHPEKKEYDLKEYVVLLSDWTDQRPREVLRYLKRAGEWYAIKKNSLQSYGEAISAGYFKDKLKQEWQRMPAMDVTDVYYNKFLMNGNEKTYFKDVKPGEVIRLRIINGSASSYFNLQYAGGNMQVIAADGINIKSFSTSKLEIATAETYDVLITIPDDGAWELRATSSDITGYSSGYFGNGMETKAPDIPKLNYFQMMREMNKMSDMSGIDMNGTGNKKSKMEMNDKIGQPKTDHMKQLSDSTSQNKDQPMNMQMNNNVSIAEMDMGNMPGMNMEKMDIEFSYDKLRALHPTILDSSREWREIHLKLTGNMLRYVWSFDNKTLSKADLIQIKKGENVRFILENTTMMRHPMHLHGHFFRFINSQGEYAPMKHTFDIKAMETVTIEFAADEEKDWFFHCHILYHMMAGMARIVSYEGSEKNEYAKTDYKKLKREDNKLYSWFDLSLHSQGSWLEGNISNNKNALEFEARVDWKGDYETETHLLHYLDKKQFLAFYIGYDNRNNKTLALAEQQDTKDNRKVFDVGFYYLLPMFIRSEWRITHTGKVRLQLERKDIPLSNNFFFSARVNTDKEYTLDFRYMISKYLSISTNYDSDYKWGAGLTWHY